MAGAHDDTNLDEPAPHEPAPHGPAPHGPAPDESGADESGADDATARSREDARRWDERYLSKPAFWSGNPNGTFVIEVSPLAPGRALDVGCGEGADAIWLAERGWRVTAVDISGAAIERARDAARATGVEVDWRADDVLLHAPEPAAYDLVSIQYPALLQAAGPVAVRGILDAVAPGGVLLVVGHALDHQHEHAREHARQNGFDPDDFVSREQIATLLSDDFTVEVDETRPRPAPPAGTPHVDDTVLRARRRR